MVGKDCQEVRAGGIDEAEGWMRGRKRSAERKVRRVFKIVRRVFAARESVWKKVKASERGEGAGRVEVK